MSKRFFTDYPLPGKFYDGRWRRVRPVEYDQDKYVTTDDGQDIKLGYIRHGRPMGPRVSWCYAMRFWTKGETP